MQVYDGTIVVHRWSAGQQQGGKAMLVQLISVLCLTSIMLGCGSAQPEEAGIVVFAAASLRDSLEEVSSQFQTETGNKVQLNFAGSGALAEQIIAGARADLFISADERWNDKLADLELTVNDTKRTLLTSSLVVIVNADSQLQIDRIEQLDALPFRYLVLGDPRFVPAGRYAAEYLQSKINVGRSVWEVVQERISPTSDVRRVLALVEADRSLVGIVYRTDATRSDRVRVIFQVPKSEVQVAYFGCEINSLSGGSETNRRARDFFEYLRSDEAASVFQRFGFATQK